MASEEGEMKCKRCFAPMTYGKALLSTLVMGIPDFAGNTVNSRGQTLSAGGPGRLVSCFKCTACGYSVTQERQSQSQENGKERSVK